MSSTIDTEIDFTKYRRPELAEHLSSIVSIAGAFKTLLLWSALAVLVVWVAVPVFFYGRVHWSLLIAVFAYASLCAVVSGLLLGIALIVNGRIDNLCQIIDVTLEISQHVSDDASELCSGTKNMPTARQIIYGVYDCVVLPTLEGVIRGQSKILGGALFRIYRWSLGRTITRLLRKAPNVDERIDQSIVKSGPVSEALGAIDNAVQTFSPVIDGVRTYLATVGSIVRRILVFPLVLVFGMATSLAVGSLLILWYLLGS